MQERSHNFNDADDESEITLTTPRFDAAEASRAHAVVPLDAVRRSHLDVGKAHAASGRGARRSWPLSVIVIALLSVASVGGIATKVLRRANKSQSTPASSIVAPATLQANTAQPPAATASRDEARATRPPQRERAAGETRSDVDDKNALLNEVLRRVEREAAEGDDEDRRDDDRGRGKHRKREGDEEKDSRKDSKRAKKGSPRLVDVLIGPR